MQKAGQIEWGTGLPIEKNNQSKRWWVKCPHCGKKHEVFG